MGPFRWVKHSPIFGVQCGSLNQGQYSPITQDWFRPMGGNKTPGWAGIGFWWGCFGSNGSMRGWNRSFQFSVNLKNEQITLLRSYNRSSERREVSYTMKFNNSFNNSQHELSIRRVVYSIQTFKIILKNVIYSLNCRSVQFTVSS